MKSFGKKLSNVGDMNECTLYLNAQITQSVNLVIYVNQNTKRVSDGTPPLSLIA